MSESNEGSEPRTGTGLPGCLILGAIIFVFGGLVVLYTFVGMTQNRAIAGFTEDEPADVSIPGPSESEVRTAREKLFAIRAASTQNRADRILFSAADLNTLIATVDAASGFRGNTRVREISSEGLVAEMAQPLRKGFLTKGFRYLNADFVFEPELRKRTIAFRVTDIRPANGQALPGPFVENYAVLDFFKLDPKNETIAAHLPAISRVYLEGEHLVVETVPRAEGGE